MTWKVVFITLDGLTGYDDLWFDSNGPYPELRRPCRQRVLATHQATLGTLDEVDSRLSVRPYRLAAVDSDRLTCIYEEDVPG